MALLARLTSLSLLLSMLSSCQWTAETQRSRLFPGHTFAHRTSEAHPTPFSSPTSTEHAIATASDVEIWSLTDETHATVAYYLPPRPESNVPAPAVIFGHDGYARAEHWLPVLRPYSDLGIGVLIPEYPGFGRVGGTPEAATIIRQFVHAYDQLRTRPEIDQAGIFVHGRAVGGAIVTALSARRRVAGLIMESTFSSVTDLFTDEMIPNAFIEDSFETHQIIERSPTPMLILHGLEDRTIPFRHAREIHRVAFDSRLVAIRAGHRNIPRNQRGYWLVIQRFLSEIPLLSMPEMIAPD